MLWFRGWLTVSATGLSLDFALGTAFQASELLIVDSFYSLTELRSTFKFIVGHCAGRYIVSHFKVHFSIKELTVALSSSSH